MMINPLVSILVPVYNAQEYLNDCIDSILSQTYSNLQIVLFDDGSKDNSLKICKEYASRDSRIEVYHQDNKGVSLTRNGLLEKAKGEYILFVDSDDWIELDMVELMMGQLIDNKAEVMICAMVKDSTPVCVQKPLIEIWTKERIIEEYLTHIRINGSLCNKIIKRDLYSGFCFDNRCSYGEDALMFWQIIQKVSKLVITNQELYHYRMNDSSLSHSYWTPERKGSNHIVWEQITKDTEVFWPMYVGLVKVRAALEDMWALYYAAASRYEYDIHIEIRQQNVRRNIFKILKSDIASTNMKLYALIASISYNVLKYIHK